MGRGATHCRASFWSVSVCMPASSQSCPLFPTCTGAVVVGRLHVQPVAAVRHSVGRAADGDRVGDGEAAGADLGGSEVLPAGSKQQCTICAIWLDGY